MSVRKDIESGALPKEEIPGFLFWWIGRNALWIALLVLVLLLVVFVLVR